MPNILYVEKEMDLVDGDYVCPLPAEVNGEPVNGCGMGSDGGTPPIGRYKVWVDSAALTALALGASWSGTINEASSRWGISKRFLALKGCVERVGPGGPAGNLDKLETRRADGTLAYRDNPE